MTSTPSTEGRTAFVTGGTGFVGTNLVRELVLQGWRTVVLRRPTSDVRGLAGLPIAFAEGDVTDRASLVRAIPEGADALFHVAANLTAWRPMHGQQRRVNVEGTRNVVEAARERRVRRIIHTSSIAAYGDHDGVISEETPSTAERSPMNYARTKWHAEVEVRRALDAGQDAVLINPANIVGPYDRGTWARTFFLVDRGEIPAMFPGRASWCHVREVVRAEIAAVDRGRTGANYLLGGADASYAEFVRLVAELVGKPVPRRAFPRPVLRAIAFAATLPSYVTRREPPITPEVAWMLSTTAVCSSARAERDLGYRGAPLREMVEDAYRWLVGEGLLPPHVIHRGAAGAP